MSMRDGSARRRLNFQREKKLNVVHSTRSVSRSSPLSSQSGASKEMLLPGTIATTMSYYESAQVPEETESQVVIEERKHAEDVRHLVQQGLPKQKGDQYAAIVREQLALRVKDMLKNDAWIFGDDEKNEVEA